MKKNKNKDINNSFIGDETESKYNIDNKLNLPIIFKKTKFPNLKNIFKKIGAIASAMLLFGTSTSAFATTQKDDVKKENNSSSIVENIENNFKNTYKYISTSKTTQERINDITNEKGNCQEVKDILTNCVKEINENYDKNAFLSFGEEKRESKEEYIDSLLDTLEDNVKKIYYINTDDKNNDKELLERLKDVRGLTTYDDSGISIYIVSEDGENIKDNNRIAITTSHEIEHVKQKTDSKNNGYIGPQSSKIMLLLEEGLAVFEGMKSQEAIIERAVSYKKEENIYIKLAYIIGEEKLKNYINTESNIPLDKFLTDNLDSKYGKGTGEKLLNELIKISPCSLENYADRFSKNETQENIQKEIDYLKSELEKEENISKKEEIQKGIERCEAFSESLKNIELDENGLATEESTKNLIKEFESYFLNTFVEKKISLISNEQEAVSELKKYYAYKKLGLTNSKGDYKGQDINNINFAGMNINEIEKNLYNKCIQYGIYEGQEVSFKLLLKSDLYNIIDSKKEILDYGIKFTDDIISSEFPNTGIIESFVTYKKSKVLLEKDKKMLSKPIDQSENVFNINLIQQNINKGEER